MHFSKYGANGPRSSLCTMRNEHQSIRVSSGSPASTTACFRCSPKILNRKARIIVSKLKKHSRWTKSELKKDFEGTEVKVGKNAVYERTREA